RRPARRSVPLDARRPTRGAAAGVRLAPRGGASMNPTIGRTARLRILAYEEYRRALETRWLLGFTVLLAALVLGLSYFGLAQGGEVGFQSFARVTLSLMTLVLFIVPLTGLVLGVTSMGHSSGTLPLLLAQPVARHEVLIGKLIGLGLALTVAQLAG